jgi:HlyD family secretion protein
LAPEEAQAQLSSARASLGDLLTRRERLVPARARRWHHHRASHRSGRHFGSGGDPLFRIARDSLIELAAEVPEADLERIGRGAPVQVTLPGGTVVNGDVRLISPRVQNNNQLGTVRVRLPVRPDLRSGGTATARFSGVARNVPAVPEAAIQFSARGPSSS